MEQELHRSSRRVSLIVDSWIVDSWIMDSDSADRGQKSCPCLLRAMAERHP
jgi:hypothetical protein